MITLAFIHSDRAFLPEIPAYNHFFQQRGMRTLELRPGERLPAETSVHWHLLGWESPGVTVTGIRIHEYASASLPPLRHIKNWMKVRFQPKPDFRLFLNVYVQKAFRFTDQVPFGFRDMGVNESWLDLAPALVPKAFDFIYSGSLEPGRRPERLLSLFFQGRLKDRSLLVLGQDYAGLARRFQKAGNIRFLGPVPHGEVAEHISRARYAINWVPDKEPFSRQTSTKLLEYAALRVPVITTRYPWVQEFEREQGGRFFYLSPDLSNLDWEAVNRFPFAFPDLRRLTWEHRIENSGVLDFLESRFPGQGFR
jgi:glycosyltransferase involved in cell wall biosynthesis